MVCTTSSTSTPSAYHTHLRGQADDGRLVLRQGWGAQDLAQLAGGLPATGLTADAGRGRANVARRDRRDYQESVVVMVASEVMRDELQQRVQGHTHVP